VKLPSEPPPVNVSTRSKGRFSAASFFGVFEQCGAVIALLVRRRFKLADYLDANGLGSLISG